MIVASPLHLEPVVCYTLSSHSFQQLLQQCILEAQECNVAAVNGNNQVGFISSYWTGINTWLRLLQVHLQNHCHFMCSVQEVGWQVPKEKSMVDDEVTIIKSPAKTVRVAPADESVVRMKVTNPMKQRWRNLKGY